MLEECKNIPLFDIYWDNDDVKSVENVIKRGKFWAIGPEIKEFEEIVAKYHKRKYAVAFNSGTSALHALLYGLGLGKNDEIIVPSFTFISTVNTALFVGAKPIFADIEDKTYGLDFHDVENKISKKTKAIIPIHYGGSPCLNIYKLKEIAEDKNILLIEDAAESMGAKLNHKLVGSIGDAAMLSFCQNKIITTGEGGMVLTDSNKVYDRLRLIRSHGRLDNSNYFTSSKQSDYIQLGYNFRMATMIAALGISQFKKIELIIKNRIEKANYYTEKLKKIDEINSPKKIKNLINVFQMYTIRVSVKSRDNLKKYLKSAGISTKVYFDPVHLTKFYRNKKTFKNYHLPNTERISKEVLSLPIYPTLNISDIDYIVKKIYEYFGII